MLHLVNIFWKFLRGNFTICEDVESMYYSVNVDLIPATSHTD